MKEIRKPFKVRYHDERGRVFTQVIVAPTAEKARQLFDGSHPILDIILDITL